MKHNKINFKKIITLSILVVMMLTTFAACLKVKVNENDKINDNSKTDDNVGKAGDNDGKDKDSEDKTSNPDVTPPDDKGDEEDKPEAVETFLDENNYVTNADSIEVVVNKERYLSEEYVPEDLVKITDVPTLLESREVNQLRKPAAEALTKLIEAAKEEINVQLYARSGYRSYKTQESTYNGYVKNHGQKEADTFSAKPGQSEHQTGLAMDISSESVNFLLEEEFGDTEEGKWVAENAHRFGFIIRYPKGKEDITGYMYEPWHLRYLGEDLATKVYESGLTLEQYFFENDKTQ